MKSKANYYISYEAQEEIKMIGKQLEVSAGSVVEFLLAEYKGKIAKQKSTEEQVISQLNIVRKLSNSIEKNVLFLVQMENLSSTLQGYDNFVSMEERINPAVQSAFHYLDEKEKAEFVRQTDSKVKRGEVL